MRTPLDALLSMIERRFPSLVGPQSDAETHRNHALVTILLFGTVGAGVGLWTGRDGFRWGLAAGCAFYAVREMLQRLLVVDWRTVGFSRWHWQDGALDVLAPLWLSAPVLWPEHLWAWWLVSVAVALMAFPLRERFP